MNNSPGILLNIQWLDSVVVYRSDCLLSGYVNLYKKRHEFVAVVPLDCTDGVTPMQK